MQIELNCIEIQSIKKKIATLEEYIKTKMRSKHNETENGNKNLNPTQCIDLLQQQCQNSNKAQQKGISANSIGVLCSILRKVHGKLEHIDSALESQQHGDCIRCKKNCYYKQNDHHCQHGMLYCYL